MKKKDKTVSLLLITDSGSTNISIKFKIFYLKIFLAFIAFFFVALIVFGIYYGKISKRMLFISNVIKENEELMEKNKRIDLLYAEISRIKAFENKIKLLTMNSEPAEKETGERPLTTAPQDDDILVEKEIDEFVQNIKLHRNLYYINLKSNIEKSKKIFASIPNILPVDGWISRGFMSPSDATKRNHVGIDIAAAYGSAVKASGPGIVTFAGWKKDFGNIVEVDHGYGFISRYGHCSRIIVKKGDLLERSQTIAFVGSSGRSSAPHCHFEIIKNGQTVDPIIFIIK